MNSLAASTDPSTSGAERRPTALIGLIVLGLTLPTAITWIYFVALEGTSPAAQQTAFGIGKSIQFLLPLVAWYLVSQSRASSNAILQPARRVRWSMMVGTASGLIIASAILAAYFLFLLPGGWMDAPRVAARAKLASLGLDSKSVLLAAAIFYSVVHSGLEEYYWRWFIFGRMTASVPTGLAVVISSLGFMAHHVVVLARYFGWNSPMTFVFSLGVAIGGVVWAELYRRSGTLLGSWFSHALVDAAIFIIAYHLAFADVPG